MQQHPLNHPGEFTPSHKEVAPLKASALGLVEPAHLQASRRRLVTAVVRSFVLSTERPKLWNARADQRKGA